MKKRALPYAHLFDAIPIGVYRRTPAGRLIDVNPALLHASHWPDRASLLKCDVQDLYADKPDLARLREIMDRDGVVRNFETRLCRHDAPPLWVEVNAVAVCDERGEPVSYEGTITPITRRKEMELELRRSEQQLRDIMDALDEVVAIVDRDYRFVAVMGHRVEEVGFLPQSVIGKTVAEVFGRKIARIHEEAGARAFSGERVMYEWQADAQGGSRWFQISLCPLRDADGTAAGLVITAYDITQQKLTQEKLANALAEKEALLKEVHHRVKNNLQIISSLLNLQFDRVQDPGLRAMVRESRNRIRAMALVHEQLYRSETLIRLDTRVFLDNLVWSLVRSYADSAQTVDAFIDAAPVPLDLDVAIPIALIINELVSNCLKHAFAGRASGNTLTVSLRLDGEDGRRELVVRDNGVGMPASVDIDNIHTLGLTLVTNLVRQIGGAVATSTDAGTAVVVRF